MQILGGGPRLGVRRLLSWKRLCFLILEAPWRWWKSPFCFSLFVERGSVGGMIFVSSCQSPKKTQQRWTHKNRVRHPQLQPKCRPQVTNSQETGIRLRLTVRQDGTLNMLWSMHPCLLESVKMPVAMSFHTGIPVSWWHAMRCHFWIETMKQPGWTPRNNNFRNYQTFM